MENYNYHRPLEVFEKDCLVRLGTCIAPVGEQKLDAPVLKYELLLPNEKIEGQIYSNEIISHHLIFHNCF